MDFQKIVDTMNENNAKERGNYHLTYGQLIEALLNAPKDARLDKQVKGIGSWRGSYTEIALYTKDSGYYVTDKAFDYYSDDDYEEWAKNHAFSVDKLPTNANKLGELLKSLIGKNFVGYKGGDFEIAEWKPLWLEEDDSTYTSMAITGIDENLKLITKKIED